MAGFRDCVDGFWTGIYLQRPAECRIKDNTNTRRRTGFLNTLNEGDDVALARRQDPPRPQKERKELASWFQQLLSDTQRSGPI